MVKVGVMTDAELYCAMGKRLRARRRLLGLTQSEVAAGCGLTFQQIQKYEAGATSISVGRLLALSSVLQIQAGDLIGGLQWPQAQPPRPDLAAWAPSAAP
jgi:transcriptional regulator with XRE-family HTH domain